MSIIGLNQKNEICETKMDTNTNTNTNVTTTNDLEVLQESYMQYDLTFKVIVLGNSGVGKSSLVLKGVKNEIPKKINPTIGFEYFTYSIKIDDQIVKLNIWDTCGQEIYKSLVMNFYRNSSLAIVVYAINDKLSFDNLELWVKELKLNSNPYIKLILIGNKIDVEDRQVSYEEGLKFKEQNKFDLFFETSAQQGENVKEIFSEAAKLLYNDYIKYRQEKLDELNKVKRKKSKEKRDSERSQNPHPYDANVRLPSKRSMIIQQQLRERDRYKAKSCSC
jgi:small GTP-binding protein